MKQQLKQQLGTECDGYENITGYVKNQNTITKEEIGRILTPWEKSVLKSKSLSSSCMIGTNPETVFQNIQDLGKATICHTNGTPVPLLPA